MAPEWWATEAAAITCMICERMFSPRLDPLQAVERAQLRFQLAQVKRHSAAVQVTGSARTRRVNVGVRVHPEDADGRVVVAVTACGHRLGVSEDAADCARVISAQLQYAPPLIAHQSPNGVANLGCARVW